MNRFTILASSSLMLCLLASVTGCGDEADGTVQPSEAAVKAGKSQQDAMQEFMKSKGPQKKKAATKP